MADIGRNRSAVTCDQVQRKLVARYSTHETPAHRARVAFLLKGKCTKCHVNGIGFGSSLRPSSSPLNFFTFAIDLWHHAQYDSGRCNVAGLICNPQCPRGGIGRRAWFRSMCRKVWGFESLRGHHYRMSSKEKPQTFTSLRLFSFPPAGSLRFFRKSTKSPLTACPASRKIRASVAEHSAVSSKQFSAHVAELVDAHGSGPCAARCGGSSPSVGTTLPDTQETSISLNALMIALGADGGFFHCGAPSCNTLAHLPQTATPSLCSSRRPPRQPRPC